MLVDFLGLGIVYDVYSLDTLVIGFEPGVDPKCFDADYFLLLIGHGTGNVHHVNNGCHALGLLDFFPAPILFVFTDRYDDGSAGVIASRRDLAFEGSLEGAFEMSQRFRTGLADARVFILGGDDVFLATRFDAW